MPISDELIKKYPSLQKFVDAGSAYVEWNDGREAKLLNYIYSHPDLEAIRGHPEKILNKIDAFARDQDFLISIGPQKGEILKSLLASEKPEVVVELGGYLGYSAILFADQLRRNSINTATKNGPRVWSLEADPVFAAFAMSLVQLAGLDDMVSVVTGPADKSLRRLHEIGSLTEVNVLFLDHVESLYTSDLKVVEELGLLKSGSTIVADNVVRPGAPEYRAYVRQHHRLESKAVKGLIIPGDFEDEIEISKVK